MAIKKIQISTSTLLKSHPIDSSSPDRPVDFQSIPVDKGEVLECNWIKEEGNHYKVSLVKKQQGFHNWYIFKGHAVNLTSPTVEAKDIDWHNPRQKISEYFTVAEVTLNDTRRIPKAGSEIEANILEIAYELDKIREDWGGPIKVTSWYRPPAVNQEVGGVSNSRHLNGEAVDIRPVSGELSKFQSWLDQNWFGALGYGLRKGFVHLDMRNEKGWKTGGTKGVRWNY